MARTKPAQASRRNSGLENGSQETSLRVPAAKRIKKIDAAKAALKEGIEVPQAAVAYIAKRYGIEMHPQHFSSVKCLLKKQEQLESAVNSPDATAMNGPVAPSVPANSSALG